MFKPKDFDKVQAYGDFKTLPEGGYVCKIMEVKETQSKAGREMITISLDIAEGEYTGFFAERWRNDTRDEKKWGAIVYQLTEDTQTGGTNRGFKTFITSVEESNNGFAVQWGDKFETCFKGKLVGCIFAKDEYIGTDGKAHSSVKPYSFRSADTIRKGDYSMPKINAKTVVPANSSVPMDLSDFTEVVSNTVLPF